MILDATMFFTLMIEGIILGVILTVGLYTYFGKKTRNNID